MSETEHKKGKLIPVEIVRDLEHTAGLILSEEGEGFAPDCYDSQLEHLEDYGYRRYVITKDRIYKIDSVEEIGEDQGIARAAKNADGSIDFEVKFYNGGCSFSEAVEGALKNLEAK